MKKIIFTLSLALSGVLAFAQSTGTSNNTTREEPAAIIEEQSKEIYTIVERMPEFPGGQSEMQRFLVRNIQYPQDAVEQNIQGKVFVKFMVDEFGNIENVSILRSPFPSLGQEALRVIKLMPKWQPGTLGGKPVKVWFNLPIDFKLQ